MDRAAVAAGLKDRVDDPNKVRQARTPFCGPAAFIRALAIDKPDAYVQAAIDLFNTGKATIGALKIEPGSVVRGARMPDNINHADWLMLSSLRDSSNALLTAADNWWGGVEGPTLPGELAGWFKAAGYTSVANNACPKTKALDVNALQILDANVYLASKHHVVMFIDSDVLDEDDQDDMLSAWPNHWVTLLAPIAHGSTVSFTNPIAMLIAHWGLTVTIPVNAAKPLQTVHFLNKFYGYVAAKS
ncbi:hypothetical protein [Vineibacter terrae]|uniref:hypothetical protein n=1 Tax=Vineibacter terrae TaxID=2586908 RepID=UPI002E32FB25|nr:hypothetical protein [Vineibacter terrae]HEX2885077.1 hypothetical protein [Vineibacter terrae]